MKRFLLLVMLLAAGLSAHAQFGLISYGAPTGSCSTATLAIDVTNNVVYSCGTAGAWQTTGLGVTLVVAKGGTGLTSGTSGGVLGYTATGTIASSVALTANVLTKGGGAGATPTNSSITDNGTLITSTEPALLGNKVFVTTDFTSANSSALQAITGLTIGLGTTAVNASFHCSIMYSQATNVSGDQLGVAVLTTAPTNLSGFSTVNTNATTVSYGVLTGLSSTTPTAVVTFTPAVTTVLGAQIDGTVETAGGGAATLQFYILNGTAADVIVIKRDSYCTVA